MQDGTLELSLAPGLSQKKAQLAALEDFLTNGACSFVFVKPADVPRVSMELPMPAPDARAAGIAGGSTSRSTLSRALPNRGGWARA
jgi:hypothetical protein